MNDVDQLLRDAARAVEGSPSEATIEADVHRGRAGLARRRRTRAIASSVGGTLAAGVLVGTVLVSTGPAENGAGHTAGGEPDQVTGDVRLGDTPEREPGSTGEDGTRLVAWTGEQPDGFVVEKVPDGWFVQGSKSMHLTIAPKGDTSHPDNFIGKLVIMVYSETEQQKLPEDGEKVRVGDRPGVVTHRGTGTTAVLHYQDDKGNWVHVQCPEKLGWTDQQLADFGATVTVTDAAKPGLG